MQKPYTVRAEKTTKTLEEIAEDISQMAHDVTCREVTAKSIRKYADIIMHYAADMHYSAEELAKRQSQP